MANGTHLFCVTRHGESVRVLASTFTGALLIAGRHWKIPACMMAASLVSGNVVASDYPEALSSDKSRLAPAPLLAGYVAFSGRQVVGCDSSPDRLLETLGETFDLDSIDVRGVTERVLALVEAGVDRIDVTLSDRTSDGPVYDLC